MKKSLTEICSIENCDRPFYGRTFCNKHYQRFMRLGSPDLSRPTDEYRFWARVIKGQHEDDCWQITGAKDNNAYVMVWFNSKLHRSHQISFYLAYGYFSTKCILHSCDNRGCCNPKHLREGTHLDNMRDAKERGRNAFGERCGASKLTSEQVQEIRCLIKTDMRRKDIAKQFSIHPNFLYEIRDNKVCKHLD